MELGVSSGTGGHSGALRERVLSTMTEDAWLSLACELIPAGQPEAENPLDPDEGGAREEGASLLIGAKLRDMGFAVDLVAKTEGRPNVLGLLAGRGGGPSVLLNDHLDTYPAGDWSAWTMTGGHPFRPTRHGDRLYARGTSDTRGNLACTLLAVRSILAAGVTLKGDLQCVYTVDEEKNGPDGSIFLLDERGLKADYTIVCEPTGWTRDDGTWGMGIAVANGGHCLLQIETRGSKTHLWRPDTGINAVVAMSKALARIEDMTFTHTPAKRAGGTPPRTTVLRVEGGLKREMQFTPDVCRAVVAVVGIVPGMTPNTIAADVEAFLATARAADPSLEVTAKPYSGSLFVSGTMEQDEAGTLVTTLAKAYRQVLGDTPPLYRKNAFNDTIRFAERGLAAVTFGPGEDGWPPINEYVDIRKAVAASKILALAILDLAGVSD
ncbi:MAG: ArgE/DapE family deacylase [Beijerinckiaceae bacterium]